MHIVVDTLGLPHAMYVSCANITDRNGALEMIKCNLSNLTEIEKYLVDGGYSGKKFSSALRQLQTVEVEVVKRNKLHDFAVLPKC